MHINIKNRQIQTNRRSIRKSDSHGSGLMLNMIKKTSDILIPKLPCAGDKLSDKCANVIGGFYNSNSPQRNDIRTSVKSISINPMESIGGSLLSKVKIPLLKDKLAKKENRNNIKFIL
jgi:hypothetical protein